MFYMPQEGLPVDGFASGGRRGNTNIDVTREYERLGGAMGKNVYDKKFDKFLEFCENQGKFDYSLRNRKYKELAQHVISDIDRHVPNRGEYNMEMQIKPLNESTASDDMKWPSTFMTIPALNKFSILQYEIAIRMLGDLTKVSPTKPIVAAFRTWIDASIQSAPLAEEKLGRLFLIFIHEHGFAREYVNAAMRGFVYEGEVYEPYENKDIENKKWRMFMRIAAEPIIMSTLEGFMYLVRPNGYVESERRPDPRFRGKYKKNAYGKVGQRFDNRYFVHDKSYHVLTRFQRYMDRISIYHSQTFCGPVYTFQYASINPCDVIEVMFKQRLKALLLFGEDNEYEKLRRLHETDVGVFWDTVREMGYEDVSLDDVWILAAEKMTERAKKLIPEFEQSLGINTRTNSVDVNTAMENLAGHVNSIVERKPIALITDPHSNRQYDDKSYFGIQGITIGKDIITPNMSQVSLQDIHEETIESVETKRRISIFM